MESCYRIFLKLFPFDATLTNFLLHMYLNIILVLLYLFVVVHLTTVLVMQAAWRRTTG